MPVFFMSICQRLRNGKLIENVKNLKFTSYEQ